MKRDDRPWHPLVGSHILAPLCLTIVAQHKPTPYSFETYASLFWYGLHPVGSDAYD